MEKNFSLFAVTHLKRCKRCDCDCICGQKSTYSHTQRCKLVSDGRNESIKAEIS